MPFAHASAHGLPFGPLLLVGASALLLALYLLGARRERRRGRRWAALRSASFAAGVVLVSASMLPPLSTLAHGDLRAHMVQHLLLGMLGPVGLVLGAPLTLLLRSLPAPASRSLVAVLRSGPVHWLTHPATAVLLNLGGMALLYATPLYAAMDVYPALHAAVHFHFLAAGCLFSFAIAGVDPGPRRPPHAVRLAYLFVAIAAHATLAKAMYAHGLPRGAAHSLRETEEAAQIMYYGGDLSELLLAVALFSGWPRRRPALGTGGQHPFAARRAPRKVHAPPVPSCGAALAVSASAAPCVAIWSRQRSRGAPRKSTRHPSSMRARASQRLRAPRRS